jgi:hypothetical protein
MNGTNPPPLENVSQPKTSGLAVWSLVLGILSLACFTTIFAGIPGVICGHKALSKIKQSSGALTGQGLAIAGLVTGYLGIAWAIFAIPVMLAIAIPNFVQARETAQKMRASTISGKLTQPKLNGRWKTIKPPTTYPPAQIWISI